MWAATAAATQRTVVATWPDYDPDGAEAGGRLAAAGLDLRLEPKLDHRTPEEVVSIMRGASGCIVSTDPFPRTVLETLPGLRVIARVGVGTDSIDLDVATSRGVAVTTTPGANTDCVADHAVAMILACARRLPRFDRSVRAGRWERTGPHAGFDLSGSTVGVVGAGAIGKAVLRRLAGFPVTRLFLDPAGTGDVEGAERVAGLDELLARSTIVSLHVPFLPETRGLIGARELALLGPEGILVNTARGGIVDEPALVEALGAGRLRAAALDVFEREPPVDERLLALDNLLLSPHVAALSRGTIARMVAMATASVCEVLAGGRPHGLVNPAALDRPGG